MGSRNNKNFTVGVIGLGYVGLPLALSLGGKFQTVGFDRSKEKIQQLRDGLDPTHEGNESRIKNAKTSFTADEEGLKGANFFIVAVPTPIDRNRNPDLLCLESASETVGRVISPGSIVVYESTVYPGVTEDVCGPIIEKVSGLRRGVDFKLGYSPERMNPGDPVHSLEKIVKVVSGEDEEALDKVAFVYGSVVEAGVHRAPSIKVAEAAKVIENTQRDLNIALMNELAIIFDKMGISTNDVLKAAATKWNFNNYKPGLVGGHCIGVDPYYLTTKAEQLGYHPQVILAGRKINDDMGRWVAHRTVKHLITAGFTPKGSVVGVLGLTFKENVADLRNSRIPDIVEELREFGVEPLVYDPNVSAAEAHEEYGILPASWEQVHNLDGLILAVPHAQFLSIPPADLFGRLRKGGVFIDIKSVIARDCIPEGYRYWSL